MVRPAGYPRPRSSATKTFTAALRNYGTQGRDPQRNRGSFSGLVRGVSHPHEVSNILCFLFRPRLVCSTLLHLRYAWKVYSTKSDFQLRSSRKFVSSEGMVTWQMRPATRADK